MIPTGGPNWGISTAVIKSLIKVIIVFFRAVFVFLNASISTHLAASIL